jgi:hypothetical protein
MDLEGKTFLRVSVDESPLKPHLAYGRAYLRVGTTNHKLDRNHYEYLLFSQPDILELVNLQNVKGQAKPYQMRQLLKLVEKHNLKLVD